MSAAKTYNFAFSENDMVGYYDHNGAMVRDDVDRSIFRIAGFENISWPRGGSGSTVTWTKVRLSCAIYSFDPSRGSYRQDHPLTSQIKFTDKLLCGDGEQLMFAKLHWRKHGPQSSATNFGSSVREVSSMSEPGQKWVRNKTDDRLQDEQTVLVDQFANPVASTCMESLPMFLGKTGSGRVGSATKRDFPASYPTGSWNTDSKVVSDPGNSTTVTFHSSVPVPVLAPGVVYKLDDKAELPSSFKQHKRAPPRPINTQITFRVTSGAPTTTDMAILTTKTGVNAVGGPGPPLDVMVQKGLPAFVGGIGIGNVDVHFIAESANGVNYVSKIPPKFERIIYALIQSRRFDVAQPVAHVLPGSQPVCPSRSLNLVEPGWGQNPSFCHFRQQSA